ncbi:MAG: bifunctional phosphopantothenoylcysteine decarboxylase/phosphopantothenate--cysteine ligase CoaBC, partial [Galactobacter sp.]
MAIAPESTVRRVVLGVAGGIAAYKATALVRGLREAGHHVDVVPTDSALRFVGAPTWEALSGQPVHTSVFEAVDRVNHVALGQRADLVLVAPTTADLLARAASGRADDLLTATLLATKAQVVMAPAMHTEMWQHPATVANVATLRARGVAVLDPAVGRLTGADSGPGRLPEPSEILAAVAHLLADPERPLAGRRVVVSAGGTREALDPVRFLGNRSSGKQGVALAVALRDLGADVDLLAANLEVAAPAGVRVTQVTSARDLERAVGQVAPGADALVMAAAVADFRPADVQDTKIKKRDDGEDPVITLVRNPDILAGAVRSRSTHQ